MPRDVINQFCLSMAETPDVFVFLSESRMYHSGTQLFYDADSGVVGYFTFKHDYDEELDDADASKNINFLDVTEDEREKVHQSYLQWIGWYKNSKNKKVLDIALETLINNKHERI